MTCPVCRRPVHPRGTRPTIDRHPDKAGNWCPASGGPIHITRQEGEKPCKTPG